MVKSLVRRTMLPLVPLLPPVSSHISLVYIETTVITNEIPGREDGGSE